MTKAEVRHLVAILEEELEGLGPFGEVTLRVQVRDSQLQRAETSRTRSVMLLEDSYSPDTRKSDATQGIGASASYPERKCSTGRARVYAIHETKGRNE